MLLIFVSSLNENMKLAHNLKTQLNSLNQSSKIINLVQLNLPMYDSKKEEQEGIPSKIYPIIEQMKGASGYLFVSPEYNFSLPPSHVNFIAWVSRTTDDFRAVFNLKYIQLATHSGGGGKEVCNAMRTQFTRLGSIVMPQEIITTYTKTLQMKSANAILSNFIHQLK